MPFTEIVEPRKVATGALEEGVERVLVHSGITAKVGV